MSAIPEMFSSSEKPEAEPIPTRDTAAASVDEDEQERRRRQLFGGGLTAAMLTGPAGVPSEMTGSRSASGGN